MIGMNPTITLPVTAAITAGHARAEFTVPPQRNPLLGRPLVADTAVAQRHLREQPALRGDGLAIAVGQREIAIAQLEHRDVGVGARLQRADRALVAEDLRGPRRRAQDDVVE